MSTPVRLVYLDNNVNIELHKHLCTIAHDLCVFSKLDQCLEDICSTTSEPESVILIVSESFGKEVAEFIDAIPQLRAVYIYCYDIDEHITWVTDYSKIGATRLFNEKNDLIEQLSIEIYGPKIQV